MSPEDKAQSWISDLVHKLQEDLFAAALQVQLAADELDTSDDPPGRATMAFISLCIDRAYTALESGFVRIARVIDETAPSGRDWHVALLHQMTLPTQDRRPTVLSSPAVVLLDELRRHRHWVRHAYAVPLDWNRLRPTTEKLAPAIDAAREDLEAFIAFLTAAD